MVIQDTFTNRQGIGYYGGIARPNTPTFFELGQISDAVKPGHGVLFDSTTGKWKLPDTTPERLLVSGIVSFDSALKPNNSGEIEFEANSTVKIAVMGHFYAKAGETLKYGDPVVFDQDDLDWIKYERTISNVSLPAPEDMTGSVDLAGISAYVQGAIEGLNASVSAYVRNAVNSLPKAGIVAASNAASGGIVELRLSGAATR